jgi:hypothetical protein
MRRLDVTSNAIRSIAYDQETKVMEVEFHNGRRSQYEKIPLGLYRDFMMADSYGGFLHTKIRPFDQIFPHKALSPLKETMSKDEESTG